MEINFDAITLEDCIRLYELKHITFVISDGHITEIKENIYG